MKEKINKELTRLQKELQDLESAASQIKKAESIASQVTDSVKSIQTKYAEHLDALKSETQKLLTSHSDESKQTIKSLSDKQKSLWDEITKQLEALKTDLNKRSEEDHSKINEYLDKSLNNNQQLYDSHSKQIVEMNKLLENYLDLAESTGQLSERIDNVNFPERFDKITINTGEIQTQIRQIQNNIQSLRSDTRMDTLTAKVKKNTRRTNYVLLLAILSFIMLIFTTYALLVKYIPQMDYLKDLLTD